MEPAPRLRGSRLSEIIRQHKGRSAIGIFSICSAHPIVLEACMRHAAAGIQPVLIEATSNQVNQDGGYTGMTPEQFIAYIRVVAARAGLAFDRIILGGDHLGPNTWRDQDASVAMARACRLVQDYVCAGFEKIHLDASMRCKGDPGGRNDPLPEGLVAERAAELCAAAEAAHISHGTEGPAPVYVIGTEVPPPGGAQGEEQPVAVTTPDAARNTLDITKSAFLRRGLDAAWDRVVATVVQPGVEFGDETICEYKPERAAELSRMIEGHDGLVYEAHSTDYQPERALRELVRDHFAILKVGPALTFAFREAVFALEAMEVEWLRGRPGVELSRLQDTVEAAMLASPANWQRYYHGSDHAVRYARKYSYSDRIRYYWPEASVQRALERLLANLSASTIPPTLLSQYMPRQYMALRSGSIENRPEDFILHAINVVTAAYAGACGTT